MLNIDWRTRGRIVWVGFALVAGFYLVTEHSAHLFGILPYLIFLACPLMHLFMHHGHGGHDHGQHDTSETRPSVDADAPVAGDQP